MEEKFKCPACNSYFNLDDDYEETELIYCPNCDEELRIVSLKPPKAESVEEEESDEESEESFGDYGEDDNYSNEQ